MRLSWAERDFMISKMEELNGTPLPEVAIEGDVAAIKARIEQELGVEVLIRPHNFGNALTHGHADSEQGIITAFAHPDLLPEDTARILLHEAAHIREQHPDPADLAQIAAYFDCERETERGAARLADEWGLPHLYSNGELMRRLDFLNQVEAAVLSVADLFRLPNAFIALHVAKRLYLAAYDPYIADKVKAVLDGEPMSWASLNKLVWEKPEALVGFDRTHMFHPVSTNQGPGYTDPLPLADDPQAHKDLAQVLLYVTGELDWDYIEHHSSVAVKTGRNLSLFGSNTMPTYTITFKYERTGNIRSFIDILQYLIFSRRNEHGSRVLFRVVEFEQVAVYEVEYALNESFTSPTWLLSLWFDREYQPLRTGREEDALRAYINAYRNFCGILRRSLPEHMSNMLYLTNNTVGQLEQADFKRWEAGLLPRRSHKKESGIVN